jgi:acetylornithine/succinyldiaminopimelate/putrescine aminotransferase
MTPGTHGTTFGGNPLAMAVGNAVLDVVLEDGFLDEVNRKALLLKQGLASVVDEFPDLFEEVRGIGLMLGLKCRQPYTAVNSRLARCRAAGGAGRRQCCAPAAAADGRRRGDPHRPVDAPRGSWRPLAPAALDQG